MDLFKEKRIGLLFDVGFRLFSLFYVNGLVVVIWHENKSASTFKIDMLSETTSRGFSSVWFLLSHICFSSDFTVKVFSDLAVRLYLSVVLKTSLLLSFTFILVA